MARTMEERWVGREGGCHCRALRYRFTAPPMGLLACHCTECQTRSASSFGLSMFLLEAAVELQQGEPVVYTHLRDSGATARAMICAACHVRLWNVSDDRPGMINLKAGTLDETSDLDPIGHVWVRSKQPWVQLPSDVLRFETQPGDEAVPSLLEAWQQQHTARYA